MKPKIIVVVGPTSSGKSDLAVELAKKFNGEVVSADSRQVYVGMDIGTGKVTKKEMAGIPHHLLDVANPKDTYTVAEFKRDADKAILDILKRDKLPILCGGTGYYIKAVVDDVALPEVKPDKKLRTEMENKSASELFKILKKLDIRRANEIDRHNRRRLVRAIEIATHLGEVPKPHINERFNALFIGIHTPDKILRERIDKRLIDRIKRGMVAEAKRLHAEGVSWKRMDDLGLEYRFLAQLLQSKITKEDMINKLSTAIWQYAKRQKTWFGNEDRIEWVNQGELEKAIELSRKFLTE